MTEPKKTSRGRKLLVATIGLASLTVSQGCLSSGNLMAPDSGYDAGSDAGDVDAGAVDDAGTTDDAGAIDDAGTTDDAGEADAGDTDAGEADAGP